MSRHERERGFERASLAKFVGEIAFTGEAAAYKRRTAISLHHEFIRIGVPVCTPPGVAKLSSPSA